MKKLLFVYLLLFAFCLSAQNTGQDLYVLKPCNMYRQPDVKSEPVHLLNYHKLLQTKPARKGWVFATHVDEDGIRYEGYVQRAYLTANKQAAYRALQKSMAE